MSLSNRLMDSKWRARVLARFLKRVEKTEGCWLWRGTVAGKYGQMRAFDRTRWPAHRLSWVLHYGPIPESKWVLHDCDNMLCVRPDHLFLGNHQDNVDDKVAKGRQLKGEQCGRARLTPDQVRTIRTKLSEGISYQRLADEYSITKSAIYAIAKGISWKHVTP